MPLRALEWINRRMPSRPVLSDSSKKEHGAKTIGKANFKSSEGLCGTTLLVEPYSLCGTYSCERIDRMVLAIYANHRLRAIHRDERASKRLRQRHQHLFESSRGRGDGGPLAL